MQTATADVFVAGLLPLVCAIQNTGANTLEAITCALNERGVRPARGTRWYASPLANLFLLAAKQLTRPLPYHSTVAYSYRDQARGSRAPLRASYIDVARRTICLL